MTGNWQLRPTNLQPDFIHLSLYLYVPQTLCEQLREIDLVFSRATGLIAGTRDKIIDMRTDDGFDEIFHKAK